MKAYQLLSRPSTNAKTKKGDGSEYLTSILYMAPHTIAGGKTVCPFSKRAGCQAGCLYSAGRGSFNNVQRARIRKTKLYLNNYYDFEAQLHDDIDYHAHYCTSKGITPVIRLNGTSDIDYRNIIRQHSDVQFYDYTKVYTRRWSLDMPHNYHVTLSYSEANQKYADKIVDYADRNGINYAVVFRKELPSMFRGRKVIDGDRDDLRFLDPTNVVVGLKAKGQAKRDNSGFVIDV